MDIKPIDPSIIEIVELIVSAAVGWFLKWLRGRAQQRALKEEINAQRKVINLMDSKLKENA